MPFDVHLVAISWEFGTYSVSSQFTRPLDTQKLKQSGRLSDVSAIESPYRDLAAILSRDQFPEFMPQQCSTATWFAGLTREVNFIVVHLAEWESGLGD